jgi:hypothetical protein
MRNLNDYRNRFNQLMESTLGDVKPLLSEQITPKQGMAINTGMQKLQPQIDATQEEHQQILNKLVIKTQSLVTPANGLIFDTTDGKTLTISKAIVLSDVTSGDLYINFATTGGEFKIYIISHAMDPYKQDSIVVKLSAEAQNPESPDASKLVDRNLDGVFKIMTTFISNIAKDGPNSSANLPKLTNIVDRVASAYEKEGIATFQHDAIDDDVYAAANLQKMPTKDIASLTPSLPSEPTPIASLNKRSRVGI